MSKNIKVKKEKISSNNNNNNRADDPWSFVDLNQGKDERRVIRSGYVKIQKIINEGKDDLASADFDSFITIINEVEDLHKLVKKPMEQLVDGEALRSLASTLLTSIESHINGGVTPSNFVSCLLKDFVQQQGKGRGASKFARDSVSWKKLGSFASLIFRNCKGCRTMIGPMNNELKQQKAVVGRKRARPAEIAQPEKVHAIAAAEENVDTDKIMGTMFEILREKRTVKLESLLLNRKSFAQTVENLFALSFLVKDGREVIHLDANGFHLVSQRNAPSSSAVMSGEVSYKQFIFRLDFKDWKLMKDSVSKGFELISCRNGPNIAGGSQTQTPAYDSQDALQRTPMKTDSKKRLLVKQE